MTDTATGLDPSMIEIDGVNGDVTPYSIPPVVSVIDPTTNQVLAEGPAVDTTPWAAPPVGIRMAQPVGLPEPLMAGIKASRARKAAAKTAKTNTVKVETTESTEIPAGFESVVADGAAAAAVSGLVRGHIRPEDVNPIAGYNVPVNTARGQATTYQNPAIADAQSKTQQAADDVVHAALRSGDMVAGAAAEGHGVLVGFYGQGEKTRAGVLEVLSAAGLSRDWAPEAKTARRQAGYALDSLPQGYVVRAEHGPKKTDPSKGYAARWEICKRSNPGEVGKSFGDVVMVATVTADNKLVVQIISDEYRNIRDTVVNEFNRRTGEELYASSDISTWLKNTLKFRCSAVRYGGSWYVPRSGRATAESLCRTLSATWGTDWVGSAKCPATPMATTEQLKTGLANGLADEANDVLHKLEIARKNAATLSKTGDIGEKAAAGYWADLQAVAERAKSYSLLLGEQHTQVIRDALAVAIDELEPLVGDTCARGSLIWDEINNDMVEE